MSKNIQVTEQFLVAEDKALQERIEFIKTQGKFFKEVLNPLDEHVQETRFILENFYISATQLPNLYKEDVSQEVVQNPFEWQKLPLLPTIEQIMTQDRMKAACTSIHEDFDDSKLSEYVVIDFTTGHIIWEDMKFSLGHSVVNIEVEFGQRKSLDLRMNNRLNWIVYLCNRNGFPQGFLKTIDDDGYEKFFELSHFSILYLFDEDHRYLDEGQPESNNEAVKAIRNMGMFTLFDKTHKLLSVTTY